ncbi:hypothetical protein [Brytella acorum]|uniref:Uncharacterized protein n=1 Tax=Brytella acorum TaxID=2959299 RepID=A0AA35Y272_9PROT|nr:hypothetical protein [Brytella acorum]CAI9119568.1 hypothetical protein LMG32879_000385 [Brytella acorum]
MSAVLEIANKLNRDAFKPAVDAYSDALEAMRAANDPDSPAIAMIVALERIQKAAKDIEELLRVAVRDSNQEQGVLAFEAGPYEVTIARGAVSLTIKDLAALRAAAPDLFEPQPDKLNRTELKKRLTQGLELAGAELSPPGPGHIQIRAKGR